MKTWIYILLFSLSGTLFAQSADVAELSIDTNYVRLGQQTVLKFSVTCSKTRQPIIPNWKDILKDKLEIISLGNADTISITDSQLKIRQEMVVTKFNEDTVVLDSLMVPLVKNRDTLFIPVNVLKIYPILEDVDLENDFRDIKSPVDIPYSWKEILPYIIGFVAVVILGFIIYAIVKIVKRSRKKKEVYVEPEPLPIIIPAHLIALEKLQKLKTEEKWFTTDSKAYITELTDVLREYIFNRWGFDAQESTSEEILGADFIIRIAHEHLDKLKEILSTADYVKFAKANTSTDENKNMLDKATVFVELTKDITTEENHG
jgi:large-conductance mechanosensitive channel